MPGPSWIQNFWISKMSPMKASLVKNDGCFHYIIKRMEAQDFLFNTPGWQHLLFSLVCKINWDLTIKIQICRRAVACCRREYMRNLHCNFVCNLSFYKQTGIKLYLIFSAGASPRPTDNSIFIRINKNLSSKKKMLLLRNFYFKCLKYLSKYDIINIFWFTFVRKKYLVL